MQIPKSAKKTSQITKLTLPFQQTPNSKKLSFVIVSDTHNCHEPITIPSGDFLIHLGDFCVEGTKEEIISFDQWLSKQSHKHKIVICGNHEHSPIKNTQTLLQQHLKNAILLQDESIEIEGIRFYGSKWISNWDKIPKNTQVLLTHRPPKGHGDKVFSGFHIGVKELSERVKQVKPQLHLFGHVHESYGVSKDEHTVYINAANCVGSPKDFKRREAIVLDYFTNSKLDLTKDIVSQTVKLV